MRSTSNALIKEIFNDADNMGNSMDVFMSNFSKNAKVRGAGIVLVDMPSEIPGTLKEQIESRALPYFVDIKPENIVSYKQDQFGNFEYVAYSDVLDRSTFEEEDIVDIVRYYDAEKWVVYENDEVLDSGYHNLGVCPIVSFGENGKFPDIGEFTQVASIQKRLFNLSSELDDVLRSQTFSVLTIQADNPSDVAITLSTDNAIKYGAGMERPGFIAPDSAPSTTYQEQIAALEKNINDITYDITTSLAAESGVALELKFQGLNGSLSNFAMRLEDFEKRLFYIASLYLGVEYDVEIMYPTDFNISDIMTDIEILGNIKDLGYSIPNYEAEKLKQIVSNDLNNVSNEQLGIIGAEIEDAMKE